MGIIDMKVVKNYIKKYEEENMKNLHNPTNDKGLEESFINDKSYLISQSYLKNGSETKTENNTKMKNIDSSSNVMNIEKLPSIIST